MNILFRKQNLIRMKSSRVIKNVFSTYQPDIVRQQAHAELHQ